MLSSPSPAAACWPMPCTRSRITCIAVWSASWFGERNCLRVITATQHYRHWQNNSLPFHIKNPARPPDTYRYNMFETTQCGAPAGFSGSQSSLEEPEREGLLRLTKLVEYLFRVPVAYMALLNADLGVSSRIGSGRPDIGIDLRTFPPDGACIPEAGSCGKGYGKGLGRGLPGRRARNPITVRSGLPRPRPFGQVTDCSWVRW